MDYQSVIKSIQDKPSAQFTGFDQIAKIALFWVNASDDYNRFIGLAQKIHAGEKPTISKDDEQLIHQLYKDMCQVGGINADEAFWVVTIWAYCYNEQVISMSDLAKWLIIYRSNGITDFDLSTAPTTLTKTQRSFATNWVRYNQIPVYHDPTATNPYMDNKVLTYEVKLQMQFGEDK